MLRIELRSSEGTTSALKGQAYSPALEGFIKITVCRLRLATYSVSRNSTGESYSPPGIHNRSYGYEILYFNSWHGVSSSSIMMAGLYYFYFMRKTNVCAEIVGGDGLLLFIVVVWFLETGYSSSD